MTSEWHLGRRHCLLVTSHWSRDLMTSRALGVGELMASAGPWHLLLIWCIAPPGHGRAAAGERLHVRRSDLERGLQVTFVYFFGGFPVTRNVVRAWRHSFRVWFIRLPKLSTRECRLRKRREKTPFICGDWRFLFFPGTLTRSLRMTFIKNEMLHNTIYNIYSLRYIRNGSVSSLTFTHTQKYILCKSKETQHTSTYKLWDENTHTHSLRSISHSLPPDSIFRIILTRSLPLSFPPILSLSPSGLPSPFSLSLSI